MTISGELAHKINNKLQLIMSMIDMALIEKDEVQAMNYLVSAKETCRDISYVMSKKIEYPDERPPDKQ